MREKAGGAKDDVVEGIVNGHLADHVDRLLNVGIGADDGAIPGGSKREPYPSLRVGDRGAVLTLVNEGE